VKSKTRLNVILAGDIGGTKTRLAIIAAMGMEFRPIAEESFESAEYGDLEEIISQFVATQRLSVTYAGFGVAGPVKNGRSQTTNLPWVIDARRLARQLGIDQVVLINDLEAAAYGLAVLAPNDLALLHPGAHNATGNRALISPGTGLGEAGLYWDGIQHRPFASEGGHADFAPRDALEMELLRYLLERHDRVSYERVLSGPGLHHIYQFLRDSGRGEEPFWLTEELRVGDPPAVISKAGLAGQSTLCEQALNRFVSILGAEAGNLALKFMATGGVYLGGGIPSKILKKLEGPHFIEAFMAKGRMRSVLESIPIRVILDDGVSLLGAARCAMMWARPIEPAAKEAR
jgi:glucokinase